MNSFYSEEELKKIGFKSIGHDVFISRKASIYNPQVMEIGNNVRIDDFCILSGKIILGDYIHIAAYTALFAGKYEIMFDNFVTVSSRTAIYAESDDYVEASFSCPLIGNTFRKTYGGNVHLKKFVLVGTSCTLLPNITLEEGVSVGAMSLIKTSLSSWGVYVGVPAKRIKNRNRDLIELERKLRKSLV